MMSSRYRGRRNHPFFEFMGGLGDWMILNVLFVVTSLPVVTIGASLTAMYRVSLRRIRKESRYAAREYMQAFREEWKDSTKLWMIFLCTGGILLFDILYGKNLPKVLNLAIGCLVVLWAFAFTYVFPLQARFKNGIKNCADRNFVNSRERGKIMWIKMNDVRLSYSGRIDWSEKECPVFIYPCTGVNLRFTGHRLRLHVENHRAYWDNYLGCILDGKQTSLLLPKDGRGILEIRAGQSETKEHEALIFKRQDACHEVKLLGIEMEDGAVLLEPPKKPERRIEVYGDSVSAGEAAEAVDYIGCEDPEHNGEYSNSWYSYAWMTARRLNAQIHDIAQGGIALMDGTGWFHAPDYIGMETVWDKIRYSPEFGKVLDWDFRTYIPQLVIVAFGQNDSNPKDYMKEDLHGEMAEKWRRHYKEFLENIRKTYPSAHIICCTTLLHHDKAWDQAIGQVVDELKDERITQYLFRRNGVGTPGHLRIPEAEEMADELSAYIENLNIEGWK